MLRISSGYSPDYLLKEVATGRESYYTGAVTEGEPPGRWWGAGAEKLGLTGLVDAQDMRALYERFLDPRAEGFRDPDRWDEVPTLGHTGRKYRTEDDLYEAALEQEPDATPERRAELRVQAGKSARQNVAFFDVTFSVQKSVTLTHTAFEAQEVKARAEGDEEAAEAWAAFRVAVEDAIWAGNNAGLAYLQSRAGYTRVGKHGGAAGRWADAHEWTVASFFQHDSRDHDPQLHIHNAVSNRVEGPDGEWLTLDSRGLHRWRAAAAAVAERTTEERLTHAIGLLVAMRPDGKAREILGVSQAAMDLISTRRHSVTAKAAELIEAFEAKHGRAPNGLERDRISQQATLVTRRAKSHTGETRDELLDRIHERLRTDIDGGLHGVARAALDAREQGIPAPQRWSADEVILTALADVQSKSAGWTESDLIRAINAALPDYLGLPDGTAVAELLDELAEEALTRATLLGAARPGDEHLPEALRLDNGRSAYEAPGARLYATPEHVRTERALAAATAAGGATALPAATAAQFLAELSATGVELGVDQAAAVRGVLTSGARVETLIGPAGTGKSYVVGTIARAWTDPAHTSAAAAPRRVFGLATSQIATEVLKAEGLTASNVAAWLGTQRRLAGGAGAGGPRAVDADQAWRLRAGDLVVVDESAMTETAALAAIHQRVEEAGAKLLLVGDHRQLAAVGAGGGMDLVSAAGVRYELAEARRFTHEWEQDASLRLRAGDESVLRAYHHQGRLLDSGTTQQAETSAARAWLGDTLAGQRSMLIVDTNEQAARLSSELRAELVRLGRVQEHGVLLGKEGMIAGVGDVVEARAIAWDLAGYEGNPRGVINRERFCVTATRDDGGLEVAPITGHSPDGEQHGPLMVLPSRYVSEHLALGYASTVHAAQGATVDTTHTVVTARTGPKAFYVGMSRGRESNTAHVTTVAGPDDLAQGDDRHTLHRDPVAVLARVLDTTDAADAADRSAVATVDADAAEVASARTAAELLADAAQLAATERTTTWLDQLTGHGVITPDERTRIAAEDGAATLTRILRRTEIAGHDPYQALHDGVTASSLDGARNLANVLYSRIRAEYADRLDPVGDRFRDWIPYTDNAQWSGYLSALADRADERAAELGEHAADAGPDAPGWAVEAFGPVPLDKQHRTEWVQQVGKVAAYREIRETDHVGDTLGAAPGPGQVEQYAAYRASWRLLGRPEADRDLMELTDGQLWLRVVAAEREEKWGPRYVGNELAGTRQAADTHHRAATLRATEADTAADPEARGRLLTDAEQARALADTLDRQAEQLQFVDEARGHWLVSSARTRVEGAQSRAELARRHVDDPTPPEKVTADEWLDAHRAAVTSEDEHRPISDDDVLDDVDRSAAAQDDREPLEIPEPDIREVAAAEPAHTDSDRVRVSSPSEAAAWTENASRALAEVTARQIADAQRETEERSEELARWYDDTQQGEHTDSDSRINDDGAALDYERDPAGAT